jgi:chemotaxis protein histidine kinase CheA
MGNVRYYVVTLNESHKNLFFEECSRLTMLVFDCLQKLEKNPSDLDVIERMVNAADVIRGGAKFLQDEDLELSSKMLIELFKGVQDVRSRQMGFEMMLSRFRMLASKSHSKSYLN